jgi:hypothetical protein
LIDGDLARIAEKTVGRTPRFMFPIAGIVLLEYFVINCGGVQYLEYLPSVSWSVWPFTSSFISYGEYISELLQLMYLQPPGVPKITFSYCTGVLWTVAVQLQGSWLILTGVIVIRQIVNVKKRFLFYGITMVFHWYARSWGSYFWLGIILTDLDIRLKYKDWLYARPWTYRAVIVATLFAWAAGVAPDVIGYFSFDFPVVENNIHPDVISGKPIGQTAFAGPADYFVPRFSVLIAIGAVQLLVEINRSVQWFVGRPAFLLIFPHMFTIYLLHGLIFWSLGALVCVKMWELGLPYWAVVLITATCSYTTLFLSLPFLTPMFNKLGVDWTKLVWKDAHQTPIPHRKTTFPFRQDVFLQYHEGRVEEPVDNEEKAQETVDNEKK